MRIRLRSRAKSKTRRATEQLVAEKSVLISRTEPLRLAPRPSNEAPLGDGFYDYRDLQVRAA